MRIISGISGGRKISAPEGRDVRPTSDKVRGAIFNSLRSKIDIESANVIDVFCGSGALGLEALSRGAAHCAFIDNDRRSLDCARKNAAALGLDDRCAFIFKSALKLKERPENIAPAHIAFLDPPYGKNLVAPALETLSGGIWLAEGALCVVEAEKSFKGDFAPIFRVLDEKIYGDTRVWFLTMTSFPKGEGFI